MSISGSLSLYGGVCGNERIRLMVRGECRMDGLATERLLQTVTDKGLGWQLYSAAGSVYLQAGGTRGEGKKKIQDRGAERKKDGGGGSECSDAGVCTVCLRIAAEKILFFCQWDVPEGDSEDYSLLTPGNTLHAEALQPRQSDRTAGKMSWVRHLRGSTVVSWFLNMK